MNATAILINNEITELFVTSGRISLIANWACALLGFCSVLLNSFVVVVLLMNRKLMENVFYLLVFHCSLVESLQAIALIAWCLPSLGIFSLLVVVRLTMMKQWIVMLLRCLNMLTILNLLLFTINEFVVVKKPLLYRRINRRLVIIFVALSWFLSFSFGMGNVLTKYLSTNIQSVYVPANFGKQKSYQYYYPMSLFINDTDDDTSPRGIVNPFFRPVSNYSNSYNKDYSFGGLPRTTITRERHTDDLHFPFLFATIVVCLTCLVIVVSCYGLILKRVRRFHMEFRFGSDSRSTSGSRKTSQTSFTTTPTITITRPSICTGRKVYRLRTLNRHKYLLVIGTVLFIDVLFIVPYSTIQLLQYLYLSGYHFASAYWWTQPRWILQLLIGFHSVLQPLCYFRMKEFRRMAMCRKVHASVNHC